MAYLAQVSGKIVRAGTLDELKAKLADARP